MERILIADDANVDRHVLMAFLEDTYEVTEAANGQEAIDALKASPKAFSCVLLDIRMPVVDGFGVLEYMRSQDMIKTVPVIALTAITEAEEHVHCYEAGVTDLLEKPYDSRVLEYKIKAVIARSHNKQIPAAAPDDASASFSNAKRFLTGKLHLPEVKANKILSEAKVFYRETCDKISAMKEPYDYIAIRELTHILIGNSQNMDYSELYENAVLLNAAAHAEKPKAVAIGLKRIRCLLETFIGE